MKKSKLVLLPIIIIFMTININAGRIKQDLLPSKQNEIVTLLKEKITILNDLITEAEIYKNQKDPLIQKGFFGLPNGFVTNAKDESQYIQTGIGSSIVITKRGQYAGILGSTDNQPFYSKLRDPKTELYRSSNTRDIFNIKMKRKSDVQTSFSNNINYIHILGDDMRDEFDSNPNIDKQELAKIMDENTHKNIQPLISKLLQKYAKFISLLSTNDIKQDFANSVKRWCVHSRMFVVELSLKKDKSVKKKIYELSIALDNAFKNLETKKEIAVSKIPDYYDGKIDKNLQCLETSKDIKYKGRICINPINVDKDVYFDYGTFETRENNFIQQNREYFKSLIELDDKLKKASSDYMKFLMLNMSSKESKTKAFLPSTNKISIEGGL